MRVTRARVGFTMAMSWLCFGCHMGHVGHIGHIGHVGGVGHIGGGPVVHAGISPGIVPAVVATRVVAAGIVTGAHVADAAGADQGGAYVAADGTSPPPCVELAPIPERADDVPLRTLDCRGHLIVLDPDTGLWRNRH